MKTEYSSFVLIPDYFVLLIGQVEQKFMEKNHLNKLPKNFQFYGYGSYDDTKPSLKKDLEEIGSEFVNGKYLYDKVRQLHQGRPSIRLNKYYSTLLLIYLEYSSPEEFILAQQVEDYLKQNQLSLTLSKESLTDLYYINYYFGEFGTIIKGTTIISQNKKKIHHTFHYHNADSSVTEIHSDGILIKGRDSIHTRCKRILDNKLYEGDSEIFYVGQVQLSDLNFILGSYISFNLHTNTVSGRVILEKCNSEEDMIERATEDSIPPYIAQEIRNNVIETPHSIAKTYLEISEKSPYSSIYGKIPGLYKIKFKAQDNSLDDLDFKILPSNYKLISLSQDVYFEEDRLELINKGTVICFRFRLSGMSSMDQVDIYVKSIFLKNGTSGQDGVFSGLDNENRLMNGEVNVRFDSAVEQP